MFIATIVPLPTSGFAVHVHQEGALKPVGLPFDCASRRGLFFQISAMFFPFRLSHSGPDHQRVKVLQMPNTGVQSLVAQVVQTAWRSHEWQRSVVRDPHVNRLAS